MTEHQAKCAWRNLDLLTEKCQSGVEEVLIFTVTSSNPKRTCYGLVQGQTQPVNIGWADSRGVCLPCDGWKKNTPTSNQSRILGYVVQPQKQWTQEASVAWALVQREHRETSKNGTEVARTYTQCAAFPASDSHLGGKRQ